MRTEAEIQRAISLREQESVSLSGDPKYKLYLDTLWIEIQLLHWVMGRVDE